MKIELHQRFRSGWVLSWLARGGPSYLCDLRLYDLGWRYVMRFARMWCDMSAWVQLDYTGWRWLAMWGGCSWLLTAASCATTWHHLALPENILNCALRESGLGSQRGNMSWVETEPCGKRPWRQGTIKRWLEREKSPIGNTPLERARRAAVHSRSSSNTLGSL